MTPRNWQAYDDGTMGSVERVEADRDLADNRTAQSELAGLRAFRRAIRESALSESVPIRRLQGAYEQILAIRNREHVVRRRRLTGYGAMAATAALAAVLYFGPFLRDPLRLDTTPELDSLVSSDPAAASNWIRSKASLAAPVVSLQGLATFEGASFGDGWACYLYRWGGDTLQLHMGVCGDTFKEARKKVAYGRTFYLGDGIGWESNGMAFYLTGGAQHIRWRAAKAAAKETDQNFLPNQRIYR